MAAAKRIESSKRIQSSVTSVSWIPLEAIDTAFMKMPFEMGVAHYDLPPPDVLEDLEQLRASDSFRFANELRAWIEVEGDSIVGYGHSGGGHTGVTKLRLGSRQAMFQAVALPDIRPDPEAAAGAVRFVQTAGGRTGVPAPRRVRRKPFVQFAAPLAWTTLALTINADGSSRHEVIGASPFPRHWIYDHDGRLAAKVGLIDFRQWYREAFGPHTPWGGRESRALVTQLETALERELSKVIIDSRPRFERVARGETLVEQGDEGAELFLLLDGVMAVERDGERIAEMGPGVLLGEMAGLGTGRRTATLRAITNCRVACAPRDRLDPSLLETVARGRRGPEGSPGPESSPGPAGPEGLEGAQGPQG